MSSTSVSHSMKVLLLFATICGSWAFIVSPVTRHAARICANSMTVLRALNDDDDDRPKLSMREENDGPTVSVKSFDEVKKGPTYSAPREMSSEPKKVVKPSVSFGKGVFGSMSVEDLKSRGFVRESVQKVKADVLRRVHSVCELLQRLMHSHSMIHEHSKYVERTLYCL